MGYSEVYTIMKNWASEMDTDIYHVYSTMNATAPLRESMMIPTKLWIKLAPAIKKAILEARNKVIKEAQSEKPEKPQGNGESAVPRQYSKLAKANTLTMEEAHESDSDSVGSGNRQAMLSTREMLHSHGLLQEDSLEEWSSTDETMECYSYMARSTMVHDHYILNRAIYKNS